MKYLLLICLFVVSAEAFVQLHVRSSIILSRVLFKKTEDNGGDGNDDNEFGVWKSIKRFLPDIVKARIEKSYATPLADSGYRYHIRILKPPENARRHTITRLTRYFPDLQYETAADIVDKAMESSEEKALVRVLNSLKEATYLRKMLISADPPVPCEIYDEKENTIVI